ncbi:hypothetical protein R3P38DRAFT_2879472 [Favolaschia claudopus]|uniref:Serine-rich protein n=1 Tax=Favolaschia claudopus TaxID=2862362 RepID=A0AAW0D0N2_9AGAR
MENVLARFRRGRTKSLSGTAALNSTSAPSTQQSLPQPQPPPLERRIHPDLDSLVANWTPAVNPVSTDPDPDPATANASSTPFPPSSFPTGLRPPRRHSVDGATPVLRPQHHDTNLEGLPEVSVPSELPLPTRARRLITRLTGSTTPPSSSNNASTSSAVAGWSTFGRRARHDRDSSRPHLTDFGETGRGSPAFSQGTFSRSASQSRSPSRPSTTSHPPDESVTYSHSGHEHPPASEVPSPSSGFTFGSRRHGSASTSPIPPLPSLDHPAFREHSRGVHSASQSRTPSQAQLPQLFKSEPRPRSSSSLPSMSTSKRKRVADNGDRAKARDVFASLRRRPGSARRRASTESSSDKVLAPSLFLEPEASGGGGRGSQRNETASSNVQARDNGGLRDNTDNDAKFDAREKRVALGGSSDTQVEGPVWLDIPAIHSTESSSSTMDQKKTSPLIMPPTLSIISATPEPSPAELQAASDRNAPVLRPPTSSRSHSDSSTRGKRKADAVEGAGTNTPPKSMKATAPPLNPSHPSSSSHAPSSFHRQKRAKVSESPSPRAMSRAASASAPNTPSASSHRSASHQQSRSLSRAHSSQASLPISALVTPNAPSVTRSRMGASYYMQDPRRPPRIQRTGWRLTFGDGGSPVHAWLFFVGFVLFPLWWVGGLCVPIPRTRRLGGDAEEKGREQVILDDPQMESDARSWRKRCRIMAVISLVTYVPFIVLLAVFLSRR